ncbi:MAG: hypothetical protein E7228_02035 [Clostridiales bacterium]|nr:hypothetical protein [Clostridiales bacterium]
MGLRDNIYKVKEKFFKPKAVFLILFIIILALVLVSRCSDQDTLGENEDLRPAPAVENSAQQDDSADLPVIDPSADMQTVFDGALFIGDSRTEGLKMFSGIENADFFCAKSMTIDKVVDGKTVDFNGHQMSVYNVLASKDYSKIYICLGINELGWVDIGDFLSEYTELIDEIKSLQEEAEIYVELIFPVTKTKSDSDKVVNNSQIYWYNVNLIEMAEANGVKYLNPDVPLLDENGALNPDATTDGVHINSEYCKKWAEYLAQITY